MRSASSTPAPVRPRRGPFLLLVTLLVVGGLTCLLTLNTFSAADEVQEQAIADANAVSGAQLQQLQVDIAARSAPAALARAAAALGMVPATSPAFLRIGPDGSVSLLGVAAPVTPPPIALNPPAAGSTALIPVAGTAPPNSPTPTPTPTSGPPTGATAAPLPATPTPTATVTLPGGAR